MNRNPESGESPSFYRRSCKLYARQTFGLNSRLCLRASASFTALAVFLTYLQLTMGHTIYYNLVTADSTAAQSGLHILSTGFSAVLRLDSMDAVLAVQFTWGQFLPYLMEMFLILLATIPMYYGAMEGLSDLLRGKAGTFKGLFRWYLSMDLLRKGVCVEFPIRLAGACSKILGVVPGLLMLGWVGTLGLGDTLTGILSDLSALVMMAGVAALYFPVSQIIPARYVLASDPTLSVGQVYRQCFSILKGRRKEYYVFCITFVFWVLGNSLCYGALSLYLLPYMTMTNQVFLHLIPARGEGAPQVHV